MPEVNRALPGLMPRTSPRADNEPLETTLFFTIPGFTMQVPAWEPPELTDDPDDP